MRRVRLLFLHWDFRSFNLLRDLNIKLRFLNLLLLLELWLNQLLLLLDLLLLELWHLLYLLLLLHLLLLLRVLEQRSIFLGQELSQPFIFFLERSNKFVSF